MYKNEFIKLAAQKVDYLTVDQVSDALNAIEAALQETMCNHDSIRLFNGIRFYTEKEPERKCYNIQKKQIDILPERYTVKVKISTDYRKMINDTDQ